MPIKYENVVPWGRSYDEYVRMFCLTNEDFYKKILGCGDGPASFNSIMNKAGHRMISIDPIYQFTKDQIENRINETYIDVLNQTKNHLDRFIWTRIHSLEELFEIRMAAMKEFLEDYNKGKIENRYLFGELPSLPLENESFDLVLCAHFLLFYSDNLSLQFHYDSITEMCRVGKEIRIFPIVNLNANISPYLSPVREFINSIGWSFEEIKVDYEFQKNGNTMLKITKNKNNELQC